MWYGVVLMKKEIPYCELCACYRAELKDIETEYPTDVVEGMSLIAEEYLARRSNKLIALFKKYAAML